MALGLRLNSKKSAVMQFNAAEQELDEIVELHGEPVLLEKTCKYLGVTEKDEEVTSKERCFSSVLGRSCCFASYI